MTFRCDTGRLQKHEITDEGFVRAEGFATRTGIFEYVLADGTIQRELRHPDEVYNVDSLKTLGKKPMTLDHPDVPVTPENAQEYTVGTVGDEIEVEQKGDNEGFVKVSFSILRKDAIDELAAGTKELSCGYGCELDMTAGIYKGQHYDAIQRNIRYNHVALVARGRAGAEARLRFDSVELITNDTNDMEVSAMELEELQKELVAMKLELEKALEEKAMMQEKLENMVKEEPVVEDKSDLEKENERLKGQLDAMKSEQKKQDEGKEMKKDHDDFLERFNTRLRLVEAAKSYKIDGLDAMENIEIKHAVAKTAYPELKLDGRSEEYVDGLIAGMKVSKKPVEKLAESLVSKADVSEAQGDFDPNASMFNSLKMLKVSGGK